MSINSLLKEIDKLKNEIDTLRPFDENMLKQVKEYFRIGLTYSSNALEGNTLTESETKIVLEEGITISGKPLIDHLEAIGHSNAYDFLFSCVQNQTISEKEILQIHRLFYYRIDEKNAGTYRSVRAYITGSKHPLANPDEIQRLMEKLIENHAKNKNDHPVIRAAQFHKNFVYIHPFIDGNGRVARLLMNLILLQHGYTIAIISPIVRPHYIHSLEQGRSDDTDFILLIAQMVKESQKDYLRLFS